MLALDRVWNKVVRALPSRPSTMINADHAGGAKLQMYKKSFFPLQPTSRRVEWDSAVGSWPWFRGASSWSHCHSPCVCVSRYVSRIPPESSYRAAAAALQFQFQVVQEYERAVIFRLGRLLHGGSRGPGKLLTNYWRKQRWLPDERTTLFLHCRYLLCTAMHRIISKGGSANHHPGGAPTGGEQRLPSFLYLAAP